MDLDAKLKPRLWGLSVLPSPTPISLDNPLANRTLRYWPPFTGLQSANISLLDQIGDSEDGQIAMQQEIQESKRLLYVSLTRPRDGLILTMNNAAENGEWMDTLEADWMLPEAETLELPDGTVIPSQAIELLPSEPDIELPDYQPTWLTNDAPDIDKLPLRLSPSSIPPIETASIGEIIELGERLEITGEYDPATLGSALHAVIATSLMGQQAAGRVLESYNIQENVSAETSKLVTHRLLDTLEQRFNPVNYYTEYPIHYTTDKGQMVSGWIDLLVETKEGFILIDHKASPRARSEWEKIALGYSGQLETYATGITRAMGKPVISRWIHFAVTGGLVEVT
jgi:ATP-dependent helicase/nuclease subunit A